MIRSLQEIFREHFPQYAQSHRLHLRELRAAHAIMDCRTRALGGHVLSCPDGHYSRTQYHSCRHRSCPRCADRPRQQWIEAQLQRLLPCAHFHVVFTLPHDFVPLWAFNRVRLSALLFDCARESLLDLCKDARHLGARPGILMALHTWGRTLSQHPHVHCLVSAGGLDAQGQWRHSRQGYLVPAKALAALFRGKLLGRIGEALKAHRLQLPAQQDQTHWRACIKAQYRKHWNVELAKPYAHGRGVALYLARYVKGGPLPSTRALEHDGQRVRFDYTDHRDGARKTLSLDAQAFLARVLWHAPPSHQHLVRHCGLYASAARVQYRQCMKLLSPDPMPTPPAARACHGAPTPPACPQCHQPLRPSLSLLPAHRFGEFSINAIVATETRLGPTGRSTGQPTVFESRARKRPSLRRRSPVN
ncbi:MAG: IS91 family transposase [Sterolibacteriaceae bacterium]|nr:IS91 family transposase [Sterolibacteriaceae bacterium]